jgi:acyl-CoA thioesterase I
MLGRSLLRSLSADAALRSYWDCRGAVHIAVLAGLVSIVLAGATGANAEPVGRSPVRIVALGDSLTAGLGLPVNKSFPARLESALKAKGLAVEIVNAGVSGDTASRGLARLDWSVPDGTDAVIVELGANDMLLGVDPKITRKALNEIVRRLTDRGVLVLLAGMRAAPNLGVDYGRAFESIYSDVAAQYGVLLYPFLLDGVAADAKLNQRDGIHPAAAGVDEIVRRMLPVVEELVARVQRKRAG